MPVKAHLFTCAPSVVTLLGHVLTLAWLLGCPWYVGAVGLGCDALDGWTARRLRSSSSYGALYDWGVDVTSLALIFERVHLLPLFVLALPLSVLAREKGVHASGRAAMTLVAMAAS